ncbi:MAG: penicillin-binding protein 2 [Gammaproteobacteria bacterium]|nr:penicillin-binding protein 2 [Gammaproteobacteria bacterium]
MAARPQAAVTPRDTAAQTRRMLWRERLVLAGLLFGLGLGVFGAAHLQVVASDGYAAWADQQYRYRQQHYQPRRKIVDRNGEPLAVSAPRPTLYANPWQMEQIGADPKKVAANLAPLIGRSEQELVKRLQQTQRRFVVLKRHLVPQQAEAIKAMKLPGVGIEPAWRRYYPLGEVAASLLGFTNLEDKGQEGLERSFDQALAGSRYQEIGKRARDGRVLEMDKAAWEVDADAPFELTLDRRLQYVAYRELKRAVQEHDAAGGHMVILDIASGEVLAMVSLPSYNPHVRSKLDWNAVRNHVISDAYEPGSTMKPLVMAAALDAELVAEADVIDTHNGRWKLGAHWVRDGRRRDGLTPADIIRHSSNVGISKIALRFDSADMWMALSRYGFGAPISTGLPNEESGRLPHFIDWQPIEQATLSFGYGLSVSTLQLAQAYATLGAKGVRRLPTIVHYDAAPLEERVVNEASAEAVLRMMEAVAKPDGTAPLAAIPGYRVAGKTGTARKSSRKGGYTQDSYRALFAGVVPASNPRLAAVVMIDDPGGEYYYGGKVAAPVFSVVMADALRMLDVPADAGTEEKNLPVAALAVNGGAG